VLGRRLWVSRKSLIVTSPMPKPTAGILSPPKREARFVISAAAKERALVLGLVVVDLEDHAGVIVETAHETLIKANILDSQPFKLFDKTCYFYYVTTFLLF